MNTLKLTPVQKSFPTFGMVMSGRSFTSDAYRYGFNGKEQDKEGMGGGASTYDYGFRIYNPGIAKFMSVDPLTASYPWYTPYQFAGNKPIWMIDLDGLEEYESGSKSAAISIDLPTKNELAENLVNINSDIDNLMHSISTWEFKIEQEKLKIKETETVSMYLKAVTVIKDLKDLAGAQNIFDSAKEVVGSAIADEGDIIESIAERDILFLKQNIEDMEGYVSAEKSILISLKQTQLRLYEQMFLRDGIDNAYQQQINHGASSQQAILAAEKFLQSYRTEVIFYGYAIYNSQSYEIYEFGYSAQSLNDDGNSPKALYNMRWKYNLMSAIDISKVATRTCIIPTKGEAGAQMWLQQTLKKGK